MLKLFHKLKNKYFLFIFVFGLFSLVSILSYGTFIGTTGKYRASEMYLGDIIYTINITSATPTTATVSSKTVNLTNANATSTIFVKLVSASPVKSKYSVQYKVQSGNVDVRYSNVTGWLPNGTIDANGEIVYEKSVKINIINASGSTASVLFDVVGGYNHLSINDVLTKSGYTKLTNGLSSDIYDDTSASTVKNIAQRVKNDTECTPTAQSPCLYGGEIDHNYLTYSGSTYRILGVYLIDGKELVKIIKDTSYASGTYANHQTSLTSWKNNLVESIDYLYEDSPFCTADTLVCSSPLLDYGLLSKAEYEKIGAYYSYLNKGSAFLTTTLNSSNVYQVKSDGTLEEVAQSTSSALRPVMYLQEGVRAKNTGTSASPYILGHRGDLYITSITLDGATSTSTPTTGAHIMTKTCECDQEVCPAGTIIKWDNTNHTIDYTLAQNSPTVACSLSFTTVDVLFESILIDGVESTSTPTTGRYTMTSSCTGGSVTWDDTNKMVQTQITQAPLICNLSFTLIPEIDISLYAYNGTLSSSTVSVMPGSSKTTTFSVASGYDTSLGGVKCSGTGVTGTLSGSTVTISTTSTANPTTCYVTAGKQFSYTGAQQQITLGPGNYQLQVWGAQSIYSSASPSTAYKSGYGGYASGKLNLTSALTLYVYVGGQPTQYNGGWNGGGGSMDASNYDNNGPGGGATDICLTSSSVSLDSYQRYVRTSESYLSRIIVAGGGGGGRKSSTVAAGGYFNTTGANTYVGTLTAGGGSASTFQASGFGFGASSTNTFNDRAGGGGGWYGGGSNGDSYGGGGSSFVWSDATASSVPAGYTPSAIYRMTEVAYAQGNTSMPAPDGTTAVGRAGNGYAIIKYVP